MRMRIFDKGCKRWCCCAALVITLCIVMCAYCLIHSQRRAFSKRTHCVGNLVHIRLAKGICQEELNIADGAPIPEDVIKRVFERDLGKPMPEYTCPAGGKYEIGPAGTAPTCSYTAVCYTYHFDWRSLRLERRAWRHSLEP